jgi:hypothetical protein
VARGACTVMQILVKWSALPKSLATWEDMEVLKQRFLVAPAAYGGGSVKAATVMGDEQVEQDMPREELMGRPRSKRTRWPNPRVKGLEWISSAV